jgi:hypothetical protein
MKHIVVKKSILGEMESTAYPYYLMSLGTSLDETEFFFHPTSTSPLMPKNHCVTCGTLTLNFCFCVKINEVIWYLRNLVNFGAS